MKPKRKREKAPEPPTTARTKRAPKQFGLSSPSLLRRLGTNIGRILSTPLPRTVASPNSPIFLCLARPAARTLLSQVEARIATQATQRQTQRENAILKGMNHETVTPHDLEREKTLMRIAKVALVEKLNVLNAEGQRIRAEKAREVQEYDVLKRHEFNF